MQRKESRKMTCLAKAARREAPLQSASDGHLGDACGFGETQTDKLADMAKARRDVQL